MSLKYTQFLRSSKFQGILTCAVGSLKSPLIAFKHYSVLWNNGSFYNTIPVMVCWRLLCQCLSIHLRGNMNEMLSQFGEYTGKLILVYGRIILFFNISLL